MQHLSMLTQAIGKASNFQSKLTLALEYICELTAWDYGEVWIPCSQDILELSPAWYRSTCRGSTYTHALEQFRLCSEEFILSPGIGLPGRVWSAQQSEWIYDVSTQSEKYFYVTTSLKPLASKLDWEYQFLLTINRSQLLPFFFVS